MGQSDTMQFELRLLSSVQSHCRAVRRKTHREAAQVLGNTCFRTKWCCCHVVSKKGPSLPETVNNFHVAYDLKPMKHQTGRLNPPPSPDFRRTLAKDNLPKAVGPGNRLRKQTSWQMSSPTSTASPRSSGCP